jgi:alkanesulfonate monooxygenase SsuD/methylene tetrahydromethanopterin reductase-like flavin-dependent oxidoreductase (luciferase family)
MPTRELKAGVYLPSAIEEAGTPGRLVTHARHAEDVGLESVWLGDHLITAAARLDSPLLVAAVAQGTETVKLGFGVIILPLRPAAWLAKEVATLQYLSGDRVLLGVGSGGAMHGDAAWRALGLAFRERGRQSDEVLDVLPDLVAGRTTTIDGAEVTLAPGATMPPVLVAGSGATLRRVARYGDEWYPAFTSADYVAATNRQLAGLAAEYGRPAPGVTLNVNVALGDVPASTVDDYVHSASTSYGQDEAAVRQALLVGSPSRAAEQLAAFAEAGVGRVVGYPLAGDRFEQVELLAGATRLANA